MRSKYPRAIVKGGDSSEAEALERVSAVVNLLEGSNKVRWVGQPIAAEWPIVECSVRFAVADGGITDAGVGVGGVSQILLRLNNVEAALIGQAATPATLEKAAGVSAENTNPLPQAAWKVEMMVSTILQTLEMGLNS